MPGVKSSLGMFMGYIVCCIVSVPIGSVIYCVFQELWIGITERDWRLFEIDWIAFKALFVTYDVYYFIGFYPSDETGKHFYGLWPYILVGGALLYKAIIVACRATEQLQKG